MRNPHFDEDARALVRRAQDRARVLRHPGLGTEHLLFAVASSPGREGVVARDHGVTPEGVSAETVRLLARPRSVFDTLDAEALATIGIDLDAVRKAVEASFGAAPVSSVAVRRRRARLSGHLPVTGRARSCLTAAVHESGRVGVGQVGASRLAAVVVTTDGGLVPPILAALEVSAPLLRAAILERAG
ncbi:Clp protease N-terminal domain-containing protein [Amycolatopsis sp. NPDC051371]|uniref:Clp protease N-terminal domain-containing protein n=1 Tax=Amycolatopsis sp. NPDC051371 TaxID=3155800 RepID=UPI003438B7C3